MKRVVTSLFAATLILSAITGSVMAGRGGSPGNDGPVTICHFSKSTATYQKQVVNASSLSAHLAKGDVLPDGYGNCP